MPKYTANGMQCYALSIAALMYLMHEGTLAPGAVYDLFGKLLSSMNVFALLFCCALMLKGYTFPSTADSGSTGVLVLDYYWGTELYPRVLGWDVKTFTNCRFGMMFWALGLLCYAHAQFLKCAAAVRRRVRAPRARARDTLRLVCDDHPSPGLSRRNGHVSSSMAVSVALQLVYITKFFWWETGYWCSMDIQHDRAGYYICWGCLVWLPIIYTAHT